MELGLMMLYKLILQQCYSAIYFDFPLTKATHTPCWQFGFHLLHNWF